MGPDERIGGGRQSPLRISSDRSTRSHHRSTESVARRQSRTHEVRQPHILDCQLRQFLHVLDDLLRPFMHALA